MIEKVYVGMRRIRTLLFLLSGIAMAAWLSGCGPCRKPEPPPDTDLLGRLDADELRSGVRLDVPSGAVEEEEYPVVPLHPPGVETNLQTEIPNWTARTEPLGSKWGLDGRRTYVQDNKVVFVRLWRAPSERAKMKPRYDIGYRSESGVRYVEMTEIDGCPVLINHHPTVNVGVIEILLADGWGKMDFTYRNMSLNEVMGFIGNFNVEELEGRIAALD